MASRQPAPSEVVEGIFKALRIHARAQLEELRDHDATADEWAANHSLGSQLIIDRARILRDWWRNAKKHEHLRHHAEALEIGGLTIVAVRSDQEVQWVRENLQPDNLLRPWNETQEEWLRRAQNLYRQRAAVGGNGHRPRREFTMHCEWFVKVQALNVIFSPILNLTFSRTPP
jgi:hypothetical protein